MLTTTLLLLAAAAAVGGGAAPRPLRTVYGTIRLDDEQAAAARVVEDAAAAWCLRNGIARTRTLQAVLLANAWGESSLRPRALGDSGCSRGLFQLNTCGSTAAGTTWLQGGAGRTADQLYDPAVNVAAILETMDRSPTTIAAVRDGTLGSAVDAFVRYVERPAAVDADSLKRQGFAEQFAGAPRSTSTAALEAGAAPPSLS